LTWLNFLEEGTAMLQNAVNLYQLTWINSVGGGGTAVLKNEGKSSPLNVA
jgi:hypothetical protein